MITNTNLNVSDKLLAKAIVKVYEMQRSFDTAIVVTLKSKDSVYVGSENFKIPHTATEVTLHSRLERLKEAGIIFSFEKQANGKILKILIREVRKQKDKKDKFLRQAQLQLF